MPRWLSLPAIAQRIATGHITQIGPRMMPDGTCALVAIDRHGSTILRDRRRAQRGAAA